MPDCVIVSSRSPRPRRFGCAIAVLLVAFGAIGGSSALVNQTTGQAPAPTPAPSPAPAPAPKPPPAITFQSPIAGEVGDLIEINASTACVNLMWEAIPNKDGKRVKSLPGRLVPDPKCVIVTSPKPGTFKLRVYGALADGTLSLPAYVTVIISDPDAPTPGPTPPGPVPPIPPAPAPAPIAEAGFRVLMVWDDKKFDPAQHAVLTNGDVRAYLNAKCVAGPDGKTKEWRMWPAGENVTGEAKLWQDAYARGRKSLPWIVISDGKTGTEEPLPATPADTLKLLQKFGGG